MVELSLQVSEVVRFMIENCCAVLGEDVTFLFGGFPERASSYENASGNTHHLLHSFLVLSYALFSSTLFSLLLHTVHWFVN